MRVNVQNFNIIGDGKTNNTEAINALSIKLKGTGAAMFFPKGEYVTGTIFLQDNMYIELEEGAVLLGSEDFSDFPKITGVAGYTRNGYWGLISAHNAENIGIFGKGEINARGKVWWESGKNDLERPRTISFIGCENVKIEDITIRNSPCWTVHPMCCENVKISGISIFNPYKSPNTDGINPESCKNVEISDCYLDVGDDCVTIKSGTEDDLYQKQHACENIIVKNCTMAHGHGGVVIGSEMSGGVKNVTVENCTFRDTDRGIRLKTRRLRGGCVEKLKVNNITMDNLFACITMNMFYVCGLTEKSDREFLFGQTEKEVSDLTPVISDILIENIKATNVQGAGIYLYGLPEMPIRNVHIRNIELDVTGSEEGVEVVMAPGRANCHGDGIFLENVQDVELSDVSVTCTKEQLTLINSKDICLNGKQLA